MVDPLSAALCVRKASTGNYLVTWSLNGEQTERVSKKGIDTPRRV